MGISSRGNFRHFLLVVVLMGCQSGARHPSPAPTNSVQAANDGFEASVRATIAGREKEPAVTVFKNVRLKNLQNVPAGQFLDIMNYGYARGLGVTCEHCHTVGDFASDEKRPKRAAREMAAMHTAINQQLLRMENLETMPPEERFINCGTCHRGTVKTRSK